MAFNLSAFDYRPDTIKRSLDQYIYGQEQAKRILSVAFWQHYSRLKRQKEFPGDPLISSNKSNVLLVGKSATGKSSLPEKICGLLDVPYARINSTSLSEAGYVGNNTSELVPTAIWDAANHKSARVPFAVVHIDEVDKKAMSEEGHDVSGVAVQNDFLSIIDGCVMETKYGAAIDTTPILFIASGAFNGLEEMIRKRMAAIGFGSHPLSKLELAQQRPTREDFVSYGMLDQFIRRFPNIAYTRSYDYEDLYHILKLEKTPFIPDLISDFAALGIKVTVEDEAYLALAQLASKPEGSGAGALMEVVNNCFRDYLYELGQRKLESIIIDRKLIEDPHGTLERMMQDYEWREPQEMISPENHSQHSSQLRKAGRRKAKRP